MFLHHYNQPRRSRHFESTREPDMFAGYDAYHNTLRQTTRPDQDEHPFEPDHFSLGNSYFRRSSHTPYRRNQNQQPSQHRPQYSQYTNTGIDQEHDRSSTNLTSTDRILAILRINREARLKLRDQSNQDDHRPRSAAQERILEKLRIRRELCDQFNQDDSRPESAAQEPAPQPSQEPETGTHTPAEPVPSEKAGAPSHDPQGLHSKSVTIKSKPTVPNQVDCRDPEPTPDSELTIGTMASAGTSNTGNTMPATRALPVPVQSESSVQSELSVQPSPSIKPTATPTLPTTAAGLEVVMNGITKASQDGANPQVKSKHKPDPTLALPVDPDEPANFYVLPSLTKPPQAPPTPTELPVPPKPPESSAQPAQPAPPAPPVPTRGMNLGSSKVLGQDVDGDNEVVGASAVDRSTAVDGNRNVENITAVNGDKDVDSGTAATDEQHVVIPIPTYTGQPITYTQLPDWSMKMNQDKKDTMKRQMAAQVQAFFQTSYVLATARDYNSVIDDKINSYQEFKDYGSATALDYNSMIYDTIKSDQEFKDFQVKRQDHEVIIQPEISSTASQAFRAYDNSLNNCSYSMSKDPAKEFKIAEHVFKDDDNKDDGACIISSSDDDEIYTIDLYTDVFTYYKTDSGPKFYGVQIDFQDHGTMTTTGADFLTDHAVHQQTGVT